MMNTEAQSHWDHVYSTKEADAVSWYQPEATVSLNLISRLATGADSHILDVGAGASNLVDGLISRGMHRVSVLDISSEGLAIARRRLGADANKVRWIEADVTKACLATASVDVWHDRAVFHFLTEPKDRAAYVEQVRKAVRPGGHVIVAAFAPDGPLQCSGLPVVRYDPEGLHAQFGAHFELLEHIQEQHRTPMGSTQHFIYCHCLVH